jgi:DNA-binding protein YbaB
VRIDPTLVDASQVGRLEKDVGSAVNGALAAAKKMAAEEMSALTGGLGGLADLLG